MNSPTRPEKSPERIAWNQMRGALSKTVLGEEKRLPGIEAGLNIIDHYIWTNDNLRFLSGIVYDWALSKGVSQFSETQKERLCVFVAFAVPHVIKTCLTAETKEKAEFLASSFFQALIHGFAIHTIRRL